MSSYTQFDLIDRLEKGKKVDLSHLVIWDASPEGLEIIFNLIRERELQLEVNTLRIEESKLLTSIPEKCFLGLTNLRSINLSNNQLETLPENTFLGLENLQQIYLCKNQLDILPEKLFSGLPKLSTLDLSGNKLDTLPENIFLDLVKLYKLDLSDNNLDSLPRGILLGLMALKKLDLSNNPYLKLPGDVNQDIQKNKIYLYKEGVKQDPNGNINQDLDAVDQDLSNVNLTLNISRNNIYLYSDGRMDVHRTEPPALEDNMADMVFKVLVKSYGTNRAILEYALNENQPWNIEFSEEQKIKLNELYNIEPNRRIMLFGVLRNFENHLLFERKLLPENILKMSERGGYFKVMGP